MAIRTVTRAGVGLVVGIIILGLLVLGGLWLVRERGDQARRTEAITIADQQLKAESDKGVALNSGDATKDQAKAPVKEETPAATSPSNGATANPQPGAAAELPQTGAAEQFGSAIVLALVAFSVTAYIGSGRQLRNI